MAFYMILSSYRSRWFHLEAIWPQSETGSVSASKNGASGDRGSRRLKEHIVIVRSSRERKIMEDYNRHRRWSSI